MLCSITINVNSNIGRDDESLNDFVEKIAKALDNGSSQKNDQFEIYIEKFKDLKNIQDEFVFQDVQLKSQTIELVACTSQPEGCNSRVHLRVTSELTEGYLKKFEKTCKEAAKRQLKKINQLRYSFISQMVSFSKTVLIKKNSKKYFQDL